jgi:hypothetical protein
VLGYYINELRQRGYGERGGGKVHFTEEQLTAMRSGQRWSNIAGSSSARGGSAAHGKTVTSSASRCDRKKNWRKSHSLTPGNDDVAF